MVTGFSVVSCTFLASKHREDDKKTSYTKLHQSLDDYRRLKSSQHILRDMLGIDEGEFLFKQDYQSLHAQKHVRSSQYILGCQHGRKRLKFPESIQTQHPASTRVFQQLQT